MSSPRWPITGALFTLLGACSSSAVPLAGAGPVDAAAPPAIEVLAVADLPREASTQGLSGTWFDPATRTLYAIQDVAPRIVPLVASTDWKTFTIGAPLALTGRPSPLWDGEGLIRLGDAFIGVTDESTPLVERFDASGAYLGAVTLPPIYDSVVSNRGIESLSLAPSQRYLFAANEWALTVDGAAASKTAGTTVRLLRRSLATGKDEEFAYRTEPLGAGTGGDMGVSDILAFSDDDLLVLERGWQSDFGNTVRIFRVSLTAGAPGTPDVSGVATLGATSPVLAKSLLVDLVDLPPSGATNPGLQPNPFLENYEGLALGPVLADGRRIVMVTADDNASAKQVPRVLVLAVRGL